MLSRENTGLIVVDVQGKLARLVANSDAMIGHCRKLILGAKALGLPIVWLEQNPDKLGPTVEELAGVLGESSPITKFTFDACEEPEFLRAVRRWGRDSWLVCGIEAHICVYQTALHLRRLSYDVHLVCDCVSSRQEANKALAISRLTHQGVSMTGLEMSLYELVKDCRASEFRTLLDLVK
ncbi:hydrolase [Ferrimonas sediminicola]|uniref:Hydrolase n=1 Tax=Ferrimonas sediminicola TaxID=2569538 RepID=A0A4U1BBR6_9GAMM|nr:hydrolase [Ferrimonas sediminicola]TKB48372.1 hydrolase [Ferrimonas sediminicola]